MADLFKHVKIFLAAVTFLKSGCAAMQLLRDCGATLGIRVSFSKKDICNCAAKEAL